MRFRLSVVGAIGVVALALPASAQSLADVARQEEARRSGLKASSTTFTNSSLKPDPNAPTTAVDGSKPSQPSLNAPAATPGNGTPAATAASVLPADDKPDEAVWRRRAADARGRVEKAQQEVAKYTGLNNDDPREQVRLAARLKRAQTEFAEATASLAAFEREAGAAGVPPSWIR
jgi:hypothetical protein